MNKMVKPILCLFVLMLVQSVQAQNWKGYTELGKILYARNDFQNAYLAFKKAQETAPNPEALNAFVAQAAYRAGEYEAASQAYSQLNPDKKNTWTHYNEGNAHFQNQNYGDAIKAYKEALRKDPNNEVARYNLVQALKKQKEKEKQNQNKSSQDNNNSENSNQNGENKQNPSDPKPQDNQEQDNKSQQNKSEQNKAQNQPANPSKLSGIESDRLLESMARADKKVQDELKEKERKMGFSKREKDW